MKLMIKYYKAAKEELSKVIFPTKEQVRNASLSVFIVVSLMAIFLAIFDLILHSIVTSVIS